MAIEFQIRAAVRDALNLTSRKPFRWGGLSGYQQLSAIGEVLRSLPCLEIDTDYLSLLSYQFTKKMIEIVKSEI
ncbi:hypothetical protein I8751_17805 [Nostocaceae cyanobacterium CENA357]|uniref:Uncharacterized protein n=1 Tax=Atlanticothrix silvestris CENA357 TaxID=1725252 RepID=A0A8J7HFC5_9CYAN|nr:hypothetical protein [Atlanticothrix silvestris]MBH8554187.1 hypothetical protein [Atlanticothrix silvestris CENA357]